MTAQRAMPRAQGPAAPELFPLRPRGPFSLAAAARFSKGFPAGQGGRDDGRLNLAFPVEGDWTTVGVYISDDGADLTGIVVSNPGRADVAHIRSQVERILSLDADAAAFPALGQGDQVVARLQQRYPGLRPVQFHTPYEAAAWAIIGHRIRMTQAASIKTRIAEELGDPVDFGDRCMQAFPAPDRLSTLRPTRGLTDRKVDQLRALGRSAADGQVNAATLRAQPRDQALTHLQALPGIGPFSAELVLLRGAGDPDAFPAHERRLHRAMAAVYHLGDEPTLDTLRRISDGWRPYRTWIAFLLRAWLEDETSEIATGRHADTLPEDISPGVPPATTSPVKAD